MKYLAFLLLISFHACAQEPRIFTGADSIPNDFKLITGTVDTAQFVSESWTQFKMRRPDTATYVSWKSDRPTALRYDTAVTVWGYGEMIQILHWYAIRDKLEIMRSSVDTTKVRF